MEDTCEIPRWQELKKEIINLKPAEFKKAVDDDEGAVLIDVRTALEVEGGTLANSVHIDYFSADFLDRLEQLDRSASYYLFCRTGRRSVRTAILMKNWGFTKLVNLDGGLTEWTKFFDKP